MKSRGRDKLEIEQYPFYTIRIKNRKLDTRKFRIIGGEDGIAVSIGSNIRTRLTTKLFVGIGEKPAREKEKWKEDGER